jgi:hypothetical protein
MSLLVQLTEAQDKDRPARIGEFDSKSSKEKTEGSMRLTLREFDMAGLPCSA